MPIMVPGLSTSSSPSDSSTPAPPTSSTQDIEGSIPDPASIGSESEDRLARRDSLHRPGEIHKFDENMDHEPAWGFSLHSDIPDWLQEITENLVHERVPEHRYSHASSSHESSLEHPRKVAPGNHSIFFTCRKTEIARSARGPKLQGPRAEDAMAEPYFVQKCW